MATKTKSSRVSRWPLYAVILILLFAIAGWSAYWFAVRSAFDKRIESWIATEKARGAEVKFSSKSIGGFPFRVALDTRDAVYRTPDGAGFSGENVQIIVQPWNPSHVMVRAPGLNQVTGRDGVRHTFDLDGKSVGSLISAGGKMQSAAMTINKGDVLWSGKRYGVEGMTLNFAPSPEAKDNLRIAAKWKKIELESAIPAAPYLGNAFGESQIIGEVTGFYPALARAGGKLGGVHQALHEMNGGFTIGQAVIRRGPLQLGIKGDLDFAPGTTNGKLGVRLEESEKLIEAMQASGNWGVLEQIMVTPLQQASKDGGFLEMDVVNNDVQIAGRTVYKLPLPAPHS